MPDKQLVWLGSSLADVRAFPKEVRHVLGFQLRRVQKALEPNDWKRMPAVGKGVSEIRIHTGREHRLLYVAKFEEAVVILHAFEKKTRKTPKRELDLVRERFRQLVRKRAKNGQTKQN